MSSDPRLAQLAIAEISQWTGTLLDIACGFGFWCKVFRKYSQVDQVVGLDVWRPYLLKVKNLYDDVVLGSAVCPPFRDKTFENVAACEVIEHLPRKDGHKLIKTLSKLSRKHVLVSTPNYHYRQGIERGNPYEAHVSFWTCKDLETVGFNVKGIGVRVGNKYTLSMLPWVGKFLSRIRLSPRLVRFSELVIGFN